MIFSPGKSAYSRYDHQSNGVALFIRWIHPTGVADALAVGMMWLILTLMFEIAFGRLFFHAPCQRIGSDYDLSRGGLLPIGLVLLALAPLITAKVRRMLP